MYSSSYISMVCLYLQSLPTAHIKGSGIMWGKKDGKYTPLWNCHSPALGKAYVAGGMWFDQQDNSLHVPVCGWYYVSTQVTFISNSTEAVRQYTHTLKVDRNCNTTPQIVTSTYSHTTFTLTGPLKQVASGMATTVISDMVKICTGGRIYVSIPASTNACCPYGDESSTMITAYLVSETNCSWPVRSYSQPVEQFQRTTP